MTAEITIQKDEKKERYQKEKKGQGLSQLPENRVRRQSPINKSNLTLKAKGGQPANGI
jgi:hypothetical protein